MTVSSVSAARSGSEREQLLRRSLPGLQELPDVVLQLVLVRPRVRVHQLPCHAHNMP